MVFNEESNGAQLSSIKVVDGQPRSAVLYNCSIRERDWEWQKRCIQLIHGMCNNIPKPLVLNWSNECKLLARIAI